MPDPAHGQLILQLYQLRTDPELRRARAWFVTEFDPQSAEELAALMLSGQAESAKYRMVSTYWEMAAALVNHGAVDRALFLAANSEHLAVFSKLQPHLEGLRAIYKEPGFLKELETLVMGIPDVAPMLERRRRLFKRWKEALPA